MLSFSQVDGTGFEYLWDEEGRKTLPEGGLRAIAIPSQGQQDNTSM